MKNVKTVKDFLVFELKGLYDTEKKFQKSLQKLLDTIASAALKKEVVIYIENAMRRINNLQWCFQYLNERAAVRHNNVADALLAGMENIIEHTANDKMQDAILIAYIRNVLYYKISVYTNVYNLAQELRLHNVEEILKETLDREKESEVFFTTVAVREVNEKATVAAAVRTHSSQ